MKVKLPDGRTLRVKLSRKPTPPLRLGDFLACLQVLSPERRAALNKFCLTRRGLYFRGGK